MFRKPDFWLVFAAFLLPSASHLLTVYALTFYLLEHYADLPHLVSTAELMNTLPVLAGFLFIGLAADRFHRKHLALAALACRFVFAAALMFSITSGWFALIFTLLFSRMLFHKLFAATEMAILQGLLQPHEFEKAASLKQLMNGLLALCGSLIALFIYRRFGITGVLTVDAVMTTCSIILMLGAKIPVAAALPNGPLLRPSWKTVLLDVRQGLGYVWSKRVLRSFLFAFMVFGLMNAILAALPHYSLRYRLTSEIETYQQYIVLFTSLLGLSFIIGSLSAAWWRRFIHRELIIRYGMLAVSLLLTLLGLMPTPAMFFIAVFMIGYIIVMINIVIGGWIPQVVEPAYMGRTSSLLDPASVLTKSAGLLLCSLLFPHSITLTGLYLLFGVLLLAGTAFIWRLQRD